MITAIKTALIIGSAWFGKLANEQKLFRRSVLLWACTLITWATYQVFSQLADVSSPVAAAYATCAGLLTVVIGFYFKHRGGQ